MVDSTNEIRGGHIYKARVISMDPTQETYNWGSKQLLEDPFLDIADYGTTVRTPPFSLEQMVLLAESQPVHGAAIEQKTIDVIGTGVELYPRARFLDKDGKSTANEDQKTDIMEWFDSLGDGQAFVEVLKAAYKDKETCGNGYMECSRDGGAVRAVQKVYHIPSHTMRVHMNGNKFVQIRQGRTAWFPRWTETSAEDPRILVTNGNRAPAGTSEEKMANEVLLFRDLSSRSTWYGIPGYISAVGHITLSIAARDYNIMFFSNAREPRYIMVVKGLVDEDIEATMDELEQALKVNHKDPHRNLLIPLTGGADLTIERLTQVANDMHFQSLMDAADSHILTAHRLPPDRLGTTPRGALTGTVTAEMSRIYKDGVVTPSQMLVIDRLNRFLKVEYARARGIKPDAIEYQVSLGGIDIQDQTNEVNNTINKVKGNVVTLNEAREALGHPRREGLDLTYAEWLMKNTPTGDPAGGGKAPVPNGTNVGDEPLIGEGAKGMAKSVSIQAAILERLEEVDLGLREILTRGG